MKLMSDIKKYEYALKVLFVFIGLLLFFQSSDLGWGFIIAGIVSKENIYWGMQEDGKELAWLGLALLIIPGLAIYLLISPKATWGYILATVLYFALRYIIRLWLGRK